MAIRSKSRRAANGAPDLGALLDTLTPNERPYRKGIGMFPKLIVVGILTVVMVASGLAAYARNPSLFGGLVAVARDDAGALNAFRLPLSPEIAFVFAAPEVTVSTAAARAALPLDVPHALASRMLGRVAALVRGLETADPDLLRVHEELLAQWDAGRQTAAEWEEVAALLGARAEAAA